MPLALKPLAEGIMKTCMGVRTLKTRGRTSCGVPLSTSRREPLERKLPRRRDGWACSKQRGGSGCES
jgi:hypothetical protein